MLKTLRAIALAVTLAVGLSAAPMVMQGCATIGGVFETDPVGASLFTMKETYEASVRTAGRLYVQKQITEKELRHFRDHAIKFHAAYELVVKAHAESKLSVEDPRVKNLKLLMASLEAVVASFPS
jgi:hypothetical protein